MTKDRNGSVVSFASSTKSEKTLNPRQNTKIPKCVEFHDDKLYVIYKSFPHIDILYINGGLLQRIKLDQVLEQEENLTLQKIRFIKFPTLQWSNRVVNKPEISQ